MKNELLNRSGHLQVIQRLVLEVNAMHLWLLKQPQNTHYNKACQKSRTYLPEYQHNVKPQFKTELEIALNALYSFILLKHINKKVSSETSLAIKTISNWLAGLAVQFNKYENGDIEIK